MAPHETCHESISAADLFASPTRGCKRCLCFRPSHKNIKTQRIEIDSALRTKRIVLIFDKMKIPSIAILALLLVGQGESRRLGEEDDRKLGVIEQIMGSPPAERLYPGVSNAKVNPGGKCRLRLNNRGNLMVERKINGQFKTSWQTGNPSRGGEFFAALQTDGNLVVYRENGPGGNDNEVVYATGTNLGSASYKLYLQVDTCSLYLSRRGSGVWNSLDYFSLSQNANPYYNSLKRGNLYSPSDNKFSGGDNLTMYLQRDCNLIIFKGNDLADMGEIKWASNTRNTRLKDCYLSAAYNQHPTENRLTLYGDGQVLWHSDVWPHSYTICLSDNGPYPCDHNGNPS